MTFDDYPEKKACITGIGQTAPGRPADHSALQLTLQACRQAVADAGLGLEDIDGLLNHPGKSNEGGGIAPVGVSEVATALGLRPTWINSTSFEGPGHMGAIFSAIMAVATGLCRHVLVFRSVAQATARMTSRSSTLLAGSHRRVDGGNAWTVPFNAVSPVNMWALYAQAYFDKYGASAEQLGWIAVNGRRMAAKNPNALYREPITLDDYLASRIISTPLRLYDCDTHIDGSTALVISHRDAARDLRNPPIHFESMGMSVSGMVAGLHEGDFTTLAADRAGDMLWQRTDLNPGDVDVAQIYDGFSIHVLLWLEAVRLCGRGEAAEFVAGGRRIDLDGELPLNTGGGQLSGGRFHGYGHTHEACVQLWGRGGERQVANPKTCLVTNGGYGYGALLLRVDG